MKIFLSSIHMKKIRHGIEDKLLMKGSSHGNFSIRTLYSGLHLSPEIDFPFHSGWNYVIPSKIFFFAWEDSLGKVITLDLLKRRGRALSNICFLYEEDEETIDHLLIHCKMVRMLWDFFLSTVWTSWAFLCFVIHTLLAWQGASVGKKRKKNLASCSFMPFLDFIAGKK